MRLTRRQNPPDPYASGPAAWLTTASALLALVGAVYAWARGIPLPAIAGTAAAAAAAVPAAVLITLTAAEAGRRRLLLHAHRRIADRITDTLGRPVTVLTGGNTTGPRARLRYVTHPRPALLLTDTPRPNCRLCRGNGGWDEPYADEEGDYGGETSVLCDCWTAWTHTLLPVPRPLAHLATRARHPFRHSSHTHDDPWAAHPAQPPHNTSGGDGSSDEPPF